MLCSRRSALTIALGTFTASAVSTRAFGAHSRQRSALTLAEVISRHVAARGGQKALDRVHSVLVMPTIVEKGSTLEARYLCSDAPAWRIDIYAGGNHVFSEGLDDHGPWLWPATDSAARDAVPDARKTGIAGIQFNLYGLHRFPGLGNPLYLEGRELIDDVNYYVVRVAMRGSYETFLYINPVSWMIERRRDYRSFHPDVDATRVYAEKRYYDFRSVGGIKTPFGERQVNWKTGALANTTAINSLIYNPQISPGELTRSHVAPKTLAKPA